jgi:predicted transcriptional regulator
MTANTKKRTDFGTGEEKLVNTNFTLVFNDWWKIQRILSKEYPTALNVFSWLIEVADKSNSVIVSLHAIALGVNLNERTCQRAIAYLKENAFLTVLKAGNMNIYVLNDQIVWKDTADKKDKFSQFSAKVHIMASEQEEPYRTQLIGHAVPKVKTKRAKLSPEEAIKGFEAANPAKSPKSGLEGLKSALNHPKEVNELVEKGWKFIEETENAYEMEDSNGFLTMLEK